MIVSYNKNTKKQIISALNDGQIVAFPTDTLFALICDANNKSAIEKIYSIKNRDIKKPLIAFVKNKKDIYKIADINLHAKKIDNIIDQYLPGALTLILRHKKNSFLKCDKETIGVRIPKNNNLLDLLLSYKKCIYSTSANISNEHNLLNSKCVAKIFKEEIPIIVEGECTDNLGSTIIDFSNKKIKILRQGILNINVEEIL